MRAVLLMQHVHESLMFCAYSVTLQSAGISANHLGGDRNLSL